MDSNNAHIYTLHATKCAAKVQTPMSRDETPVALAQKAFMSMQTLARTVQVIFSKAAVFVHFYCPKRQI